VRTAAVLPVKRFAVAKRRLRTAVMDQRRGELARAMFADVLEALARCAAIERTLVVTADPAATELTRAAGALVIGDDAENGQSVAVAQGVKQAIADGYERVLCVPGDCPALDPRELDTLLHTRPGEDAVVVIVPDRHGTGTNALVLCPPDAIPPSFGPESFERHQRLAQAAGLGVTVMRPPSLLLDVDTGADLAALRRELSAEVAPHTHAALDAGRITTTP
jgi:2-phospho-L-lactate/phosphoenolpyruvate guanylyltransferase